MLIISYLLIYFMILSVIYIFMNSLYLLINKITLILEFEIVNFMSMKMEYLIFIDWMSLMFMSVMLMISLSIMFYSIEYMHNDKSKIRFLMLMFLFVMSMILMIISPNMISILMGWDGLGVVSFCLVIFYDNENSYYSGMVTILMNRVGDIMILMSISLIMYLGSWNFMFFVNLSDLLLLLLLLTAFTKSAQIPFSSWLPLAMAAPTPVSSLVHSSTLVTAGVYLLIRFNYLFSMNLFFMKLMMFFSLMTLLMSGVSANMEFDLKKIIALSTLSQLGVMIFCLSMNLKEVSFFHLLTHAMFKSMLFMCSGIIIHNSILNQDIRYLGMIIYSMPMVGGVFSCSLLSLCGMPFLSGFFSKDKILELYLMGLFNNFLFFTLFFSMGLTVMYSLRVMYFTFWNKIKLNMFIDYKSKNSFMSYSLMLLFFMTLFMGSLMNWMMFTMKSCIYLYLKFKLMIYLFMLIGFMIGLMLNYLNLSKMKIFKLNILYILFLSLWYLLMIMKNYIFNQMIFINKFILLIDMSWNEYLLGGLITNFIKKLFFKEFFKKNFFYLMIFIFYLMMIYIF